MVTNQNLYQYLDENAHNLTNFQMNLFESSSHGLCELLSENFMEGGASFEAHLKKWLLTITPEMEKSQIPVHQVLIIFYQLQKNYIETMQTFYQIHSDTYQPDDLYAWTLSISMHMEQIIIAFVEKYTQSKNKYIELQQKTITKLSAPIISLTEHTAILPVIGYFNNQYSAGFADNVLDQCDQKNVTTLIIDLSAVNFIDTTLAKKLFTLLNTLHLIGVSTILAGVRPELAQTAVELGIQFNNIEIKATLAHAIHDRYNQLGFL